MQVAVRRPGPASESRLLRRVFANFDLDGDGKLSQPELAAFIQAVNPGMRFTPAQMAAVVDELLLAYAAPGDATCLTVQGLEALYADGLGDLAADWATLALPEEEEEVEPAAAAVAKAAVVATAATSPPRRVAVHVSAGVEEPQQQRPAPAQACAAETPPPAHHHLQASPAPPPSSSTPTRPAPPSPASMTGKALVFTPVGPADGPGRDTPASWRRDEEEERGGAPPSPTPTPTPPARAGPPVPTMDDLEAAFREWKAMVGVDATPAPGQRPVLRPSVQQQQRQQQQQQQRPASSDLAAVPEGEEVVGARPAVCPCPASPTALDFLRLGRLLSQRGDHVASGAAAALGLSAIKAAARRPASSSADGGGGGGEEEEEGDAAAADPLASCDPDVLLRLGNAVYELGEYAAAEAAYAAGLGAAGEAVAAPPDDGGTATAPSSSSWVPRALLPRSRRPARPFALALVPRLRLNLGMTLEVQGDLAGARDQYAAASAGAPGHPHALKLLGSVRYALGALAPALAALDAALASAPAYADAHSDRGMCLWKLGRAGDAVTAFETARAADPGHGPATFNLANLRRERGEWADAVALYRAFLAETPTDVKARLGLGVSLIGGGRLEEAEAALEAALAAGVPAAEVEAELARHRRLAAGRRAGDV